MNRIRKWGGWLAAALVIILLGIGAKYWAQRNTAPEYKTSKIESGPLTASVLASGTLSPVVSVQVGSQVSGQLKEMLVDFNSEVKAGQLIARIDPETFEYKVRQAQADVDAARSQVLVQQANINAQRAEVARIDVNAADAKRDLELKQQLVEKGFISTADRDKAQATWNALVEQSKTARAQLAVVQANARNAEAIVRQREASLAQANVDLSRTAIKAPVNGVVIKRSVEKGQTVAASLQAPELFIIAGNLTDMQVDTSIDESEIGRIRLGQKASFTVDAFPGRTFDGAVTQIRKAAQTVSNVVTYTVEVSAANPKRELLPGMTANVRIVTDSRGNVLKVTNAALRFKPAGADSGPAAGQADRGGNAGAGGQLRALREQLEKELQLSDAQKTQLDAIFAGMREKFRASRDAPEGERQKIAERDRSELRARIADMLTPEQKKKYQEIAVETGQRRSGGFTRGRIYTFDQNGKPKALDVRLGLTDGTMTEVVSPDVKEGMEIITGVVQAQGADTRSARPPGPRMF